MNGKICEEEFQFAVYAITELIKDENKTEVDFSKTSLSPSNIMFVLEQMGIKIQTQTTTSNCEDFYTIYEGGLTLYYNAWLFLCILMKGSVTFE